MLGFYNYTVYLTYIGLISAVAGIFFAFGGNIKAAGICLLFSGLCDMFDGKIARTKKDRTEDEKNFGIQIDSLCDIVCFGVLPAAIGISTGCDRVWQLAFISLFLVCGVIRLGYFNVTETSRQQKTSENRKHYTGLPITSSAVLIPLLLCFRNLLGLAFPYIYSVILGILAICYIVPLNVKKPGTWGGIILIIAGSIIFILTIIF